jgi:hypothetical protein
MLLFTDYTFSSTNNHISESQKACLASRLHGGDLNLILAKVVWFDSIKVTFLMCS